MIKKLFFLGIVLSAFLCACTTEDTGGGETENQQQLEIGFSPYLGRVASSTRASVYTGDNLGTDGIGIYAMYTKDQMYHPTATSLYIYGPGYKRIDYKDNQIIKTFTPNYMDNVKLYYDSEQKVWTYKPIRYWPMFKNEFLTFFAYGPYESTKPTLYTMTKTTTGEGDAAVTTTTFTEGGDIPIYKKYVVDKDPKKHKDIVWNYNPTWNLQLYTVFFNDDGTYQTSMNYYNHEMTSSGGTLDDLWQPADKTTYPGGKYNGYYEVKFKMAHACSRIAYSITSPALKNADNFKTENETNSNTQIKINKIVFLGDAKSGADANPNGAFYGSGYFNIANGTSKEAQWDGIDSENKVAFTFTNFYDGTYNNKATPNIWQPGTTSNSILQSTKDENGNITVNSIGNASDGYLFVIPQDLSLKDDDSYPFFHQKKTFEDRPLYCYIDYTIQYKDITTGEVKDGVTYQSYGYISQNFEAGKAYVIHIQIGSEDGGSTSPIQTQLNAVHFTVNLDPWADEQETNANAGIDPYTDKPTGKL